MKKDELMSLLEGHSQKVADLVKENREKAAEAAANPVVEAAMQAETKRVQDAQAKTRAGRFVKALVAANGKTHIAEKIARDTFGDAVVAKALAETTWQDGGAIIPPSFSSEIVEVLRASTVVRKLGARVLPMPNGTFTLPFGNTGSSAFWVGENVPATSSQQTFGQLNLKAHKLMVQVPISNDMLEDASPNADQWIQDDMGNAVAVAEDLAFLRGAGTGNSPRGLKSWAASTLNSTMAGSASTVDEIIGDLAKLISTVLNLNIPLSKGGWAMNYRTEMKLRTLKDSVGGFYFKDEMSAGKLLGMPFASTSAIPINLNTVGGRSSVESELYFADYDKIILGQTGGMSVTPILGGAYYDAGTAAVVSGISNDQTVIVARERVDLGARFRGNEIALLQGVTWGA